MWDGLVGSFSESMAAAPGPFRGRVDPELATGLPGPGGGQQGYKEPIGLSYGDGDRGNSATASSSAFPANDFSGISPIFQSTSTMRPAGGESSSKGFFSTGDSNLMAPATRLGQRQMAYNDPASATVAGAFAQSEAINKAAASAYNGDSTNSIETNYFTNTNSLLTSSDQIKLESDHVRNTIQGKNTELADDYISIEDQHQQSGSRASTNQIPVMLGAFQHPDFAGSDPASVGIDTSGMTKEVVDATTRMLSVGQPMMSDSLPPDAFFQLNLAINPRVFENAPLTQTVKKNGTARQDATGYIGYPQDLRIPMGDASDSFATPYAPYAQDMYLSDLLKKLDTKVVEVGAPSIHGERTVGMSAASQKLLDLDEYLPLRQKFQGMEQPWGGEGSMVDIYDGIGRLTGGVGGFAEGGTGGGRG